MTMTDSYIKDLRKHPDITLSQRYLLLTEMDDSLKGRVRQVIHLEASQLVDIGGDLWHPRPVC